MLSNLCLRLAMTSTAAAHFPPVEKADTAPELKGWGLVSAATGTFVGGRLVMMILSLGAGAKAIPGLPCLRVHFGSYLQAGQHDTRLKPYAVAVCCPPCTSKVACKLG